MFITLTTDFGTQDAFVGAMKGVILSLAPLARIVDISHDVPAQDVVAGALILEAACRYFPKGTIHLAVVDPGVGSRRAAIGIQTDNFCFVGPDNGLFDLALRVEERRDPDAVLIERRAIQLTQSSFHRRAASPTFHGRDIFAPVAAWLANGNILSQMGEPLTTRIKLNLPEPVSIPDGLELRGLRADRFGNVVTNLTRFDFQRWNDAGRGIEIRIGEIKIRSLSRTYSDVPSGEWVAYFNSADRLEMGIHGGRAANALRDNDRIELTFSACESI